MYTGQTQDLRCIQAVQARCIQARHKSSDEYRPDRPDTNPQMYTGRTGRMYTGQTQILRCTQAGHKSSDVHRPDKTRKDSAGSDDTASMIMGQTRILRVYRPDTNPQMTCPGAPSTSMAEGNPACCMSSTICGWATRICDGRSKCFALVFRQYIWENVH